MIEPGVIRRLVGILGRDAVLVEPATLLTYESDAYMLARSTPGAVVLPGSPEETQAVVRVLAEADLPMVPRGAGTSLSGGCHAEPGSVVVSLARMRTIEKLDIRNRQALVQAGVVNLALSRAAAPHGLHYAPDPSSQQACTIGGNIAANSGGPHTLKHGVTVNHVLAVELVTPDGERRWIGSRIPGAGGPDLVGAVVGNEGTFGIVTRAWVRLVPPPVGVRTLLASFADVDAAAGAVSGILSRGVVPAALEFMDQPILAALHDAYGLEFREGAGAVLLIEADGPEAGLAHEAALIEAACIKAGAFQVDRATTAEERDLLWRARKRAFGALGRLSRNYCTQDGVVPRTRLPQVLKAIRDIGTEFGLKTANVFHAGDGNLHPVLLYDDRVPGEAERVVQASDAVLRVCLELGGSLTGEHGIGIEKVGLMAEAFSADTLNAFADVRAVFDPRGRSNPDKLLPGGSGCADPVGHGPRRPGRRAPL